MLLLPCKIKWTSVNNVYLWTLRQKSFNETKGLVRSKCWYLQHGKETIVTSSHLSSFVLPKAVILQQVPNTTICKYFIIGNNLYVHVFYYLGQKEKKKPNYLKGKTYDAYKWLHLI